ncbi:MAG: hypothetical protein LBL35_09335 [Clostridiales bacterium]|jgi:hypothetical protein|nr:hypothetical protein [Clostridiales bacterium]
MSDIISAWMDTDEMDVYRNEKEEREGAPPIMTKVKILKDAPCHISFSRADSADVGSERQTAKGVVIINCVRGMDIRNGDFVTARRLGENGTTLAVYDGIIGKPNVSASRKSARLEVR